MTKLLHSLVLFLSLFTLASAVVTPTPADPAKRQTNRRKIIAREAMKRAKSIIQVIQEHNFKGVWQHGWGHTHQWPHPSGYSYPTCKADCGYPGLARYKGWDLSGDDLPGNPVDIGDSDDGEKCCLDKCNEHLWSNYWKTNQGWKNICVGVEYAPNDKYGKCYLKGIEVGAGNFTNKSYGAKQPGTYLDLIGGCAAWAPYVPKAMDAVCCNSN